MWEVVFLGSLSRCTISCGVDLTTERHELRNFFISKLMFVVFLVVLKEEFVVLFSPSFIIILVPGAIFRERILEIVHNPTLVCIVGFSDLFLGRMREFGRELEVLFWSLAGDLLIDIINVRDEPTMWWCLLVVTIVLTIEPWTLLDGKFLLDLFTRMFHMKVLEVLHVLNFKFGLL